MDKKVAGTIKDVMGKGEKIAPVKSIKLEVKFQKVAGKKEKMAEKMAKKK